MEFLWHLEAVPGMEKISELDTQYMLRVQTYPIPIISYNCISIIFGIMAIFPTAYKNICKF